MTPPSNGLLPSLQTLLLRAALCDFPQALAAFEAWRAQETLAHPDRATFRLLPLLAHNLSRLGVRDPLVTRLVGVHRRAWYENQMLLRQAARVGNALQEAGLRVLVLKGAALATRYYADAGLRPMLDFDLLVETPQAGRAMRLLCNWGWKPKLPYYERLIPVWHAAGYAGPAGEELDLHWHALLDCCEPEADRDFWAAAQPLRLGELEALSLCPADELLHILAHGVNWNPLPPLRWVADAMMVLRAEGDCLDWPRLLAQARRRDLTLVVRHALEYLRAAFAAPVPPWVLHRLENTPVSLLEGWAFRSRLRPLGVLGLLPQHLLRYRRVARTAYPGWGWLGFPDYIARVNGLASARQLPGFLGRKLGARLAQRLRRL